MKRSSSTGNKAMKVNAQHAEMIKAAISMTLSDLESLVNVIFCKAVQHLPNLN